MPDQQAAKVLEPSEQAFDLPPAAIPAERPPVLRFGPAAMALVRSNHCDPLFGQARISGITIVSPIPDQAGRQGGEEAGGPGR